MPTPRVKMWRLLLSYLFIFQTPPFDFFFFLQALDQARALKIPSTLMSALVALSPTGMPWLEPAVFHTELLAYSQLGGGIEDNMCTSGHTCKWVTICWMLLCPTRGLRGRGEKLDVLLLWVFPSVMQ